ncbi:MAG: ABC transporter substrate-binding protein [Chloroflexota bacterium]|nr:ABC transporter substrate-binding protein [Chloroflexota bacterium]
MNVRKLVAVLAILALVLPLVAACAPQETPAPTEAPMAEPTEAPAEPTEAPPEPTEAPPEPTPVPLDYDVETYGEIENLDPNGQTVVFWYQHTLSREELMLSMIDDFNRTNEWGITVQGETQGGYTDLYQKIIAGIPANQLPSMAVAYQNQAATYAVQGALVALDPYVDSEKWGYPEAELDDFFPIALGADYLPQFEARYGWPPYKSMEVMYYNEDWLAELGYDGPPETWEEFKEMACAAAEQPFSGATGEGGSLGYEYTSQDASRFATFSFSRGGNIINETGTGYVFNGQEGLAALEFLKDLEANGCAGLVTERYGDQSDFGAGRVLFTFSSISGLSYYVTAVDEGAGFNWSVNPPPHSLPEPRLNIYGASISVFESTPEEQLAAWLFIKWLSEPEQQAQWASGTGYFPTRQAAADQLADYFAENPTYAKAFTFMAMDYGVESPVAGYDECRAAIAEMIIAVLGGEDTQTQLDATVEQCNEYLEDAAP